MADVMELLTGVRSLYWTPAYPWIKDNRLTGAVVFIVEINVAGAFPPDSDVWH
jgi:hypothetical protein